MFRTIGFRFSGTAVSPHKNIQLPKNGLYIYSLLMPSSRNKVFHRKSDFYPTRKRVGFTPQFI